MRQIQLLFLNYCFFYYFLICNLEKQLKQPLKRIAFWKIFQLCLKYFQLFGITMPGQEVHKPKTNPDNNKNEVLI